MWVDEKTLQSNLHLSSANSAKSKCEGSCSKSCKDKSCPKNLCAPLCKTHPKRKGPAFHITQITPADTDVVLPFLRRSFFCDEPMVAAIGLSGCCSTELERHCLEPLKEGLSLLAVDVNKRPLAIAINATINPGDGDRLQKEAEVCKCKKTKELLKFWVNLEKDSRLWERMNVSHIWEVRILATSFAARSYGLAKILLERSINMAREDCYPLVRVDCTSYYSAKAVESLDFYCLHSTRYKDYLGPNGKPVFPPSGPHQELRMYVLPLTA